MFSEAESFKNKEIIEIVYNNLHKKDILTVLPSK